MKRALAMALGAMMVAGSAAPASAASQVDFSGYFRVYNINATNIGHHREDPAFTDSYFGNRLVLDMTFRPTDELEVVWQLRAPHLRRWGAGNDNRSGIETGTWHAYGVVKQDWGNVYIGRMSQEMDEYGLSTLGWVPSTNPIFTYTSPFDPGSASFDGVRYANRWDNGFGLLAQYAKRDNNSGFTGATTRGAQGQGQPDNFHSDQDNDSVLVEASYLWDGGGAALGVEWRRDATTNDGDPTWDATNAFFVNPAIAHSWGDFSIHFEGQAGWGTTDSRIRGIDDRDEEGYGAYLDFDYNYGPGNVILAAWYSSGTKLSEGYGRDGIWDGGGKSKSLVSVDQGNFYPLLVAYHNTGAPAAGARNNTVGYNDNAVGMANNAFANYVADGMYTVNAFTPDTLTAADAQLAVVATHFADLAMTGVDRTRTVSYNNDTGANHWAAMIGGNHAFTDDISMHYAVAYLALNQPNYRIADRGAFNADGTYAIGYTEQDKDMGFEVDLGFSFKLLDNLTLTSGFGYMFNGDAYKSLRGYTVTQDAAGNLSTKANWEDAEDSYVWNNTLTFSF